MADTIHFGDLLCPVCKTPLNVHPGGGIATNVDEDNDFCLGVSDDSYLVAMALDRVHAEAPIVALQRWLDQAPSDPSRNN